MSNTYSADDLLSFLAHASERGLMPAATAQALAVATRNVFAVLDDDERAALPVAEMDAVIKRFVNKRARDFTPESLKEYGRRVRRAVDLYVQWRDDPANFSIKTRVTQSAARKRGANGVATAPARTVAEAVPKTDERPDALPSGAAGYQTAFPIRPGHLVTIANVPQDLTAEEAKRLAQFIALLVPT